MTIKDIRGLKYPDEYLTRYFFKEGLDKFSGKAIEFGCSNGNNLSLFYQYNYDVLGVDISSINLDNAEFNFENLYKSTSSFNFYNKDMELFVQENKNINADIFLIPNVACYLTKEQFLSFLTLSKENNLFKSGASFFLRTRTTKDFRHANGKDIGNGSFIIEQEITGEKGITNTCYNEFELIELLKKSLNLYDFKVCNIEYENVQNGYTLFNSDIVIWGKIK